MTNLRIPAFPDASADPGPRTDVPPDDNMFRLIVENAADVIVRGDAARNRTYVSPSSREMLGYEPEELLGAHAFDLVHPEDRDAVAAVFARIGPDCPVAYCMFRMRRKDGTYLWIGGRYRHLPRDGGILAILRDITEPKAIEAKLARANAKLEAANQELQYLAHRDGLTGLANRRRFDELLETEFRRARRDHLPLGMILVDVDHFKAYNDRYGHTEGDECLRRIGKALRHALLRPADLAARYGGEEFVALLPCTHLDGSLAIAEQFRQAIQALAIPHLGSAFGVVSVSVGASSMIPIQPGDRPLQLVNAADAALYEAKDAGRNSVRGSSVFMDRQRALRV
jgi:diguanylate cyclase (GGDEF)-like protein/PAS domain S-box-containing protein